MRLWVLFVTPLAVGRFGLCWMLYMAIRCTRKPKCMVIYLVLSSCKVILYFIADTLTWRTENLHVYTLWRRVEEWILAPLILNIGLRWRWVDSVTPWPSLPGERFLGVYSIKNTWVRDGLGITKREKLSTLLGIEPRFDGYATLSLVTIPTGLSYDNIKYVKSLCTLWRRV